MSISSVKITINNSLFFYLKYRKDPNNCINLEDTSFNVETSEYNIASLIGNALLEDTVLQITKHIIVFEINDYKHLFYLHTNKKTKKIKIVLKPENIEYFRSIALMDSISPLSIDFSLDL